MLKHVLLHFLLALTGIAAGYHLNHLHCDEKDVGCCSYSDSEQLCDLNLQSDCLFGVQWMIDDDIITFRFIKTITSSSSNLPIQIIFKQFHKSSGRVQSETLWLFEPQVSFIDGEVDSTSLSFWMEKETSTGDIKWEKFILDDPMDFDGNYTCDSSAGEMRCEYSRPMKAWPDSAVQFESETEYIIDISLNFDYINCGYSDINEYHEKNDVNNIESQRIKLNQTTTKYRFIETIVIDCKNHTFNYHEHHEKQKNGNVMLMCSIDVFFATAWFFFISMQFIVSRFFRGVEYLRFQGKRLDLWLERFLTKGALMSLGISCTLTIITYGAEQYGHNNRKEIRLFITRMIIYVFYASSAVLTLMLTLRARSIFGIRLLQIVLELIFFIMTMGLFWTRLEDTQGEIYKTLHHDLYEWSIMWLIYFSGFVVTFFFIMFFMRRKAKRNISIASDYDIDLIAVRGCMKANVVLFTVFSFISFTFTFFTIVAIFFGYFGI